MWRRWMCNSDASTTPADASSADADALAKRQAHVTFDPSALAPGAAGRTGRRSSRRRPRRRSSPPSRRCSRRVRGGVVTGERGTGGVRDRARRDVRAARGRGGRNLVLVRALAGPRSPPSPEAVEPTPGGALVRDLPPAPARAPRPGRARVRERVRQRAEPRREPSRPARAVAVSLLAAGAAPAALHLARARRRSKRSGRRQGRPRRRGGRPSAGSPPAIRRAAPRRRSFGSAGRCPPGRRWRPRGQFKEVGWRGASGRRRGADGGGAPGQLPGGVRGKIASRCRGRGARAPTS